MAKGNRNRKEKRESAREVHKSKAKNKQVETDSDDIELSKQLRQIGVALRETTGDGNCLFRAISDQLTGAEANHKRIREEAVDFIKSNSDDFKPFIEEDFNAFLSKLGTLGEFAGNEALVAIARLYKVDIVIHQTNQAVWTVAAQGQKHDGPTRQLHIAYHDWEHYSSIRKLNDSSLEPALVHVTLDPDKPARINHAVREDDIKIELEEEELSQTETPLSKPAPSKPVSGKEKKRLRKEKATERRAKKSQKEKDIPPVDDDMIQPLPDMIQHLRI